MSFQKQALLDETASRTSKIFRTAMILSTVESCIRKRLRKARGSEKRTPWRNQDVKAIWAKKNAFKALLQSRSLSDLQCRNSEAWKAAAQTVKVSKERSWEEFGRRLDSNYSSANEVFWQTIRRLPGKSLSTTTSIKDSTGNILRDKKILSRWKEYFKDLLNPVRATPTDTCDWFWERGSLHVDRSGSSHTKIEIRKGCWWRNPT